MPFYEVIAGSRSYGLEIESSDTDLCRVADSWRMCMDGGYNLIQIPPEEFVERVFARRDNAYYLQWLYPAQVRSDNQAAKYLMEQRESITAAQRPAVYRILTGHASRLEYRVEELYQVYPKRMAYAILFHSIAARYGEGEPFAQAHRPGAELRELLLRIRRGTAELEEAKEALAGMKRRSEAAGEFYAVGPDEAYLAWAEQGLRALLELE